MKSYYRVLRGILVDFSWKSIWKVSAPLRMAFFFLVLLPFCCVALGRVLTIGNLRKWGIIIIEWCFMCKNHAQM